MIQILGQYPEFSKTGSFSGFYSEMFSLTEKRRNKSKYLTRNFIRFKFEKMTSMPNTVKNLGSIKCHSSSSPKPVNALGILSDTTVRQSAVDQQVLKPYWKSEKRTHFSRRLTILLLIGFSKTLLTIETRLTGQQFLAVDLYPTLLNMGTTYDTFQQSGKQDSFRQLLRSSASMSESSGSQLFRTITGIQSGSETFDKSSWEFNHLGSYRNIMQFQISSRRENR